MSHYKGWGKHPITGKIEACDWLDDYFGRHIYGAKFSDGKVYRNVEEVEVTFDEVETTLDEVEATFDRYRHITDQTAEYIKNYIGDPKEWLQFCATCWDIQYGKINEIDTEEYFQFEFITGGWSNNEAVIVNMKQNLVQWSLCWESSHRGGLYIFKIYKEGSA